MMPTRAATPQRDLLTLETARAFGQWALNISGGMAYVPASLVLAACVGR
jgi:hypothetical protein